MSSAYYLCIPCGRTAHYRHPRPTCPDCGEDMTLEADEGPMDWHGDEYDDEEGEDDDD